MEEAEKKIFEAVSDLLKNYPDYEKPFFRTDGDLDLNKVAQCANVVARDVFGRLSI